MLKEPTLFGVALWLHVCSSSDEDVFVAVVVVRVVVVVVVIVVMVVVVVEVRAIVEGRLLRLGAFATA